MFNENKNDMETLLQFVEDNEDTIAELCVTYENLHNIKMKKNEGISSFKMKRVTYYLKKKVRKIMNQLVKLYNDLDLTTNDYFLNKYWETKYKPELSIRQDDQRAINYIVYKYNGIRNKVIIKTIDTMILGCCVALPISIVVPPTIPVITGAFLASGFYYSLKYRRFGKKCQRKQKIIALLLSIYYEDFE